MPLERTPFYFESQGAWLFAWLHRDASVQQCQRGVIICPPTGHEQIHTHRSLRHLADALATAGMPTMRFDYHGTGDSAGTDEDPDRLATWLANVRSAIQWMRAQVGCTEMAAIGLRLGAALAMQAAALEPLTELVLWAPVVKGRTLVREWKALSLAAGTPVAASGDLEPAGFEVTEQTARSVEAIDLLQIQPRCARALIVARDDLPADARLLEHLQNLGIQAEQKTLPGYAGMLDEPHLGEVPQQAIAEIVAWMKSIADCGLRIADSNAPGAHWNPQSAIRNPQFVERAVSLSWQPDLFGILSEPLPARPGVPAVVLINAGSAYRAGPNRLHVLLARRLALEGVPCLRLDLNGLGDSIAIDSARENDPYAASAFRDIDLALHYVRRELSVTGVVLMGLCSGAYFAWQSAVQFADRTLLGSVMINPLTFHWKDGMAVGTGANVAFQAYRDAMNSAREPGKWLRLVTGRSKLGIGGALRTLLERWRLRRQAHSLPRLGRADTPALCPTHPEANDVPGDLARVARTNRRLTFVFSRSDPGYDMLTFAAKRQVDDMCQSGQMRIVFIENADHTFSRRACRSELVETIVADIGQRIFPIPHKLVSINP